jgi:hypothetical protein
MQAPDSDDFVGPPDYSKLLNAAARGRETLHNQRIARQRHMIEMMKAGVPLQQACTQVGIALGTYKDWRKKDKGFAAEVDSVRIDGSGNPEVAAGNPNSEFSKPWTFAEFRWTFFNYITPGFQQLAVNSYENTPKGNITLILFPPEHGKTTIFEDYACWQLGAVNPQHRFLVGSEAESISSKILGRIQNRMEPDGPFPAFVARFGPFVPQNQTGRKTRQVWNKTEFNIYKKLELDERDYSMKALGLMSSVVSTRTDQLHIDDAQSKKTLNLTTKFEETLRQDWLSRSGESAPTSMNGTRVGEDDIYRRFIDDDQLGDILRVIKLPAIVLDPVTREPRPLFPRTTVNLPDGRTVEVGYTMEMLDRLRRKAGPDAWERNYMQRDAVGVKKRTFSEEDLMGCVHPLRSLHHRPPRDAVLMLSLDPAIGGHNVVAAFRVDRGKLELVGIREQVGLMSNEAIMAEVEMLILDVTSEGAIVSDLVIESKNFQAGLCRDLRLDAMRKRYGFRVLEHQTGVNKYDQNVGVSSMVNSFVTKNFELPYADDDYTRHEVDECIAQFKAWRPLIRGNKLKQDRVMVFWFAWIIWRDRASVFVPSDASGFKVQGVPYGVRPVHSLTWAGGAQ